MKRREVAYDECNLGRGGGSREMPDEADCAGQTRLTRIKADEIGGAENLRACHMHNIQSPGAKLRRVLRHQLLGVRKNVRPGYRCHCQSALLDIFLDELPCRRVLLRGRSTRENEPRKSIAQFGPPEFGQRKSHRMSSKPRVSPGAERVLHVKRNEEARVGVIGHALETLIAARSQHRIFRQDRLTV